MESLPFLEIKNARGLKSRTSERVVITKTVAINFSDLILIEAVSTRILQVSYF